MTGKALASLAGLAPNTISRLERGMIKEPSQETVAILANALNYPIEFFDGSDLCDLSADNVSFRSMSAMSAAQRDAAITAGQFGVLLLDRLSEQFNLPLLNLLEADPGTPPDVAARLLRQRWGLGDQPIPHMIRLLEAKGIRVLSLNEQNLHVDAFSFWAKGQAYIFLNNQKSAERMRYDAAHELGHLVLHRQSAPKDTRQGEKEANEFAASFIMPEADVRLYRPRTVSPAAIIKSKARWRVSAMALTYRLFSLRLLTEWQNRMLYIQLGQMGYRSSEPQGIERETSALWPMILGALWEDKKTRDHLATDIGLPLAEVNSLLDGLLEQRKPRPPRNTRLSVVK